MYKPGELDSPAHSPNRPACWLISKFALKVFKKTQITKKNHRNDGLILNDSAPRIVDRSAQYFAVRLPGQPVGRLRQCGFGPSQSRVHKPRGIRRSDDLLDRYGRFQQRLLHRVFPVDESHRQSPRCPQRSTACIRKRLPTSTSASHSTSTSHDHRIRLRCVNKSRSSLIDIFTNS